MSLGKLKLTYSFLIFIFFKNLLHAGFYFSVNKDQTVSFLDNNKNLSFRYKKYKKGFFISYVKNGEKVIENVFNDGFKFEKKSFKEINNKYILVKSSLLERLSKNKGRYTHTTFNNGLKITKVSLIDLMQSNSGRIDLLQFLGIEDNGQEIDFQLGYCKQEYLLDEEVLDWATGMLPTIKEAPFQFKDYIKFNNCRDKSICRQSSCVINKTSICKATNESVFESIITEAMKEGMDCLKRINPDIGKVLLASIYDQKVNKNKKYTINCTGKNFENAPSNFEGFGTTPCHDKYPNVFLLTPGCYDGGKKLSTVEFKRNVLHELLHTLGYVHGVPPDIPYGCGNYCFPKRGAGRERTESLKNICSDSSESQAYDYYNGIMTSLGRVNDNALLYSQDPDWALQDYRWRLKDVSENGEFYRNTFQSLQGYEGQTFVDLGTGLSLVSNYSVMLNSLIFIPESTETAKHLAIAKNLSKMLLGLTDEDLVKISEQSQNFKTDKSRYIIGISSYIDQLEERLLEGKSGSQRNSISQQLLTFKAISVRKTCLSQYEGGELSGEAIEVCRKSPISVDLR